MPPRASAFCFPQGVHVDSSGHVFVSDAALDRVLRFTPPLTNGKAADLVFGQPSFTDPVDFSPGSCFRVASASTLCTPQAPGGMTVDFRGDLFIADSANSRVLRYNQPSQGTQPPGGTRSAGVTQPKPPGQP
jgi:sugar lactone lactonase YvrE